MKTVRILTVIFLSCYFLPSCDSKATNPVERAFYFNSFESPQDTSGWYGLAPEMFITDPAPMGGKRSLYIDGGCIQPAAHLDFPAHQVDGQYRVHCWGKLDDIASGGSIILAVDALSPERRELHLIVDDTVWTLYYPDDTIHCPAKHTMRLEILAGGFFPAGMYIDCLRVERVK
jgi:hypothetical protein